MKSALLALALLVALPAAVVAQARADRCRVQLVSSSDSGGFLGSSYFASGDVRLRCAGQPITMETDSVIAHASGDVEFHGYMRYRDTTVAIDARQAYYRKATETWEARGNVVVRNLGSGSIVRGPAIDYMRPAAGVRDSAEMYATGRPEVEYFDTDSTPGTPSEPYVILADRLRSRGNALIWAGGRVTIDRSDLRARGDSLRLDTGADDDGTLLGQPIFEGLGVDSFSLRGARIDFQLEERKLSYITAAGRGHLVRGEWDLVADTIAADLVAGAVEQLLAWGDSARPDGKSTRHAVRGDSVAFDLPGEVLRQIRVFGDAWVAGTPDSASGERDWMMGDTVVADFAEPAGADSSDASLSRLSARHDARSYHRVEPTRAGDAPSIAYVRGAEITIEMQPGGGERVARVEIAGQVEGVQLDPDDGQARAP
ncbi:MAG TPA: hypothetical protein VFT04_08410 [Gemmatimonadales bacterium]|nr:hypothetical protein [Gemmatimonadales bacterium]